MAFAAAKAYQTEDAILARAIEKKEPPLLIILDGVEDPHNLGAVLRSAEAAGVHGVFIPERRAAGLTSVVAKVSAGAIDHIPVARVTEYYTPIGKLKGSRGVDLRARTDSKQGFHRSGFAGPSRARVWRRRERIKTWHFAAL